MANTVSSMGPEVKTSVRVVLRKIFEEVGELPVIVDHDTTPLRDTRLNEVLQARGFHTHENNTDLQWDIYCDLVHAFEALETD